MHQDPLHLTNRFRKMQVIGYGANHAALRTIQACGVTFSFIVDDNDKSQGETLAGVPICPPSTLAAVDWTTTRLIACADNPRSILSMQAKLEGLGLRYPEHWIDCSAFHFTTIGKKLTETFGITPDPLLFWRTRALTLQSTIENWSSISGTWLFIELLKHLALKARGGVAEMGVFRGGNALTSLILGPQQVGWKYHLFDSFEGFPEFSTFDPASRRGEFTETSLAHIRSVFADFSNVIIHPGFFRDTMQSVSDERFNLVYVDCDLYDPTIECCRFFYGRLNRGGVLLFHDYYAGSGRMPSGVKSPFTGVKRAADEFFHDRPEKIVEFPETTHALIVKQ